MTSIVRFTIGKVGSLSEKFLEEKILLIFSADNVMSEVKKYSILIEKFEFFGEIENGQFLYIDSEPFKITAIGKIAEKNLREINHITFKADGSLQAELPGTIYLEEKKLPNITQDTKLEIRSK